MYQAVDNIGVAVADLESALDFYETLGFECERYSESDGQASPAADTYLYVFETHGPDAAPRSADLFSNPVGIDHISIRVDDVDQTYDDLAARGVEFFQPPVTESEWGLRLAGTRDPSGNVFYFVKYE